MKMFHTVMVLALAGQMLIACGPKPADTGGTTTTTTTTTTAGTPVAATTPATGTTPAMGTTPAATDGTPAAAGDLKEQADQAQEAPGGPDAAGQLEGNTVKFPEAGIQFNVPAGWVAENDGGNVSISSPDNQIVALFFFPPQDQAKATAEAMGEVVDEVLDNVKPDEEVREGEMAGMQWVTVTGTGDMKGTPVKWGVDMVQAKKPVVVFYMGEATAWEANKAVLEAFDESFVPIEGGDAAGGGDEAAGDEAGDEAAGDASPAAGEGGH